MSSRMKLLTNKLSVIVLTLNEENNLPNLISSFEDSKPTIYVVDSGSTDLTKEIALSSGCKLLEHKFEGYAKQRNWSFDNIDIQTPWTLCLDADERLTPELLKEITSIVYSDDASFDGFMLRKRTYFFGKWIKHGGQYPAYHLRLFKTGKGRCEDRLYDQHFVVDGNITKTKNDYIDIITSSIDEWTNRHNKWATLEAEEILKKKNSPDNQVKAKLFGTKIERKRFLRTKVYQKFPIFYRPFLLFIYDYIFRFGFLDGKQGLMFFVLQRFWFRFLTDSKIYEVELKRDKNAQ